MTAPHEWQPIATCPAKVEVVLYYPPEDGRNTKREYMRFGCNGDIPRRPTHWMPKPAPPAATLPDSVEGRR